MLSFKSAYAQVVTVSNRQSSVKVLYQHRANEMLINVSKYPAERVSFKAERAKLILGGRKVTLVPCDVKATLKIFYKDSLLAMQIFL